MAPPEVNDYETGRLVGHVGPRGRFVRLVQLTYSLRKHLAGSFVEGRLGLLDQSLLANLLLFLRLFEGSVLKSFGLSMLLIPGRSCTIGDTHRVLRRKVAIASLF